MDTTLNTLITLTFFAPMVLLVATDLLTARTVGPSVQGRRAAVTPLPTHRTRIAPVNAPRYLEAA